MGKANECPKVPTALLNPLSLQNLKQKMDSVPSTANDSSNKYSLVNSKKKL